MRKHRNRLQIYADILTLCMSEGFRITELIRRAGINVTYYKQVVNPLVEKGLLEVKNGNYATTSRGLEYLRTFDRLLRLLS